MFLACLAVAVVAALATQVEQARACSCVQPDPWSLMKQADGAFVGRLVGREDIGQGRARLTFDVERAAKGNIGTSVDVVTANNSAACGIEMPMGYRTGLFLSRDGGRWTGTLCWQVSPEDMLAAATLPAPNGKWPAAMFVGGRFGPARTIALDAKGRTLGYGVGPGLVQQVAACPGGRRVAELVYRGSDHFVAIREQPTFWVVREQRLPGRAYGATSLTCVDELGDKLALFSSDPDARGMLTQVTPKGATTLWRGSAYYASFWRNVARVQALGGRGTKIVRVDLRTGSTKILGTARATGLYQLEPDPAGTKLAGASSQEGVGDPRLVVIDLSKRPISARSIPLPTNPVGSTLWIGRDRLAYAGGGAIRIYTSALRPTKRITGWSAGDTVLRGNTAYGVERSARLLRVALPTGKVQVVRRLPGAPEFITTSH